VNKKIVALVIILVNLLAIFAIRSYNIRWQRDFSVKYVGSEGEKYFYEVTNNTSKSIRDVTMVFEHLRVNKLDFEYSIGDFQPGETQKITVRLEYMKQETGMNTIEFKDYDFKRLKY